MSKASAIQVVNASGVSGFNTMQTKTLRKMLDVIYADVGAVVVVSEDADNEITVGSDGGAFYEAP